MKGKIMSTHATEAVTTNGAFTRQVTAVISDDYLAPTSPHSVLAQATMTLGLVTGLWVAISPWFLVLQHGGNNAAASNLIVGLAVAALGLYALSGSRGFLGLQVGSVLAGVWLIISPFILDAKYPIATPMYWSNVFAGALVVLIGLAALAETRRASAR
jgi:SPW repeat